MTIPQSLLAFALAAGLLTITPGVDTAMVLRTAATGGTKRAIFAAIGVGFGLLAWGAAASLGLGALLAASALAFTALKIAGAAYLLWLGVKLIRNPRAKLEQTPTPDQNLTPAEALRRGFLSNILNPKIGMFYVTFLPQFIPEGANTAAYAFMLTCVQVGLDVLWFTAIIAAAAPLARRLKQPKIVRALDRLTGGVLISFGLKLALSAR
jgi:threonine/homoserine/homoserine lactone efflux protein